MESRCQQSPVLSAPTEQNVYSIVCRQLTSDEPLGNVAPLEWRWKATPQRRYPKECARMDIVPESTENKILLMHGALTKHFPMGAARPRSVS